MNIQRNMNVIHKALVISGLSDEIALDLMAGWPGKPGTGSERVDHYLRFRAQSEAEIFDWFRQAHG